MRIFMILFAFVLLGVFIYTLIELNRQKNKAEDDLIDKKQKGTQKRLEEPKEKSKDRDEDQDLK